MTGLEPFAKINCPECRQSVRVRRKFDHFLIIKQIGEGGMSRVFEAEDETLGRRVALKILNRTYSRDATRMAQFQQEALTTARVTHPNVIKLYSVGYDQGHFFIAMELVNGGSLEGRIKRDGQVPEKDALRIGRQVAEGLRAAYRMGLLHRDVKPANILFTEDGTAKVVDFGLALFAHHKDETGEIWATPYYVAPEKVIDNQEDFRSDLFSLGATLYHALTGRPPHKANSNSIHELRMIKCRRVALEESGMSFAPRTVHVIDRLVAFKPEERPGSYDAAVDELRLAEGLTGRTVMSRMSMRRKVAIGALAAIVLAYTVGWLGTVITSTKPVVQYGTTAPLGQNSLLGDGTTVGAGQRTVADRFLEARRTLLGGDFKKAEQEFDEIIKGGARQPALNWARYNSALCALISERRQRAEQLFADIGKDADVGVDPTSVFFRKLSLNMAAGLGLEQNPRVLNYNDMTEEAMGFLAHGLAQWHFGDPVQGARSLDRFLKSRQPDPELEWMDQYRRLITPYAQDLKLVRTLDRPDNNLALADAEALLAETRKIRSQLQTKGMLQGILDKRIHRLTRSVHDQHLAAQRAEMKQQLAHRKRELDQLAELSSTLPALVRGYDFSPAISILKSMQFESPEVQAAVENKLYLYEGARDFLAQLAVDLSTRGWGGRLVRLGAAPLDGRVTALTLKDLTMTLPSGALTVPMEQVGPPALIEMAQTFFNEERDSATASHRQELIAIFARVAGQPVMANAVANDLMQYDADFRSRWLKVLQGGS